MTLQLCFKSDETRSDQWRIQVWRKRRKETTWRATSSSLSFATFHKFPFEGLNHLLVVVCCSNKDRPDEAKGENEVKDWRRGESGPTASTTRPPLTLFYICLAAFFLHANCIIPWDQMMSYTSLLHSTLSYYLKSFPALQHGLFELTVISRDDRQDGTEWQKYKKLTAKRMTRTKTRHMLNLKM